MTVETLYSINRNYAETSEDLGRSETDLIAYTMK
jgi:hypothetical protein